MHLLPYLIHMALYVLNTTRSGPREEKNLAAFLELPEDKWLESCYAPEGPLYFSVMAILVTSPKKWRSIRVRMLQRLLLLAQTRSVRFPRI
jgi:E3 ubiquitin-protein ligase UBR4